MILKLITDCEKVLLYCCTNNGKYEKRNKFNSFDWRNGLPFNIIPETEKMVYSDADPLLHSN